MSWFAAKDLDANGELQWDRDVWNDSIDMTMWMELAWYQRGGKEFDETFEMEII